MLLFRILVLEVAMGVCLCAEVHWVLRLAVNVESGSSTLWIISVQHLASGKGGALLSY